MPQLLQTVFVVSVIGGSAIVWSLIISRWRRGIPLLPYEPRRPVPWTAIDLSVLLLVYLSISLVVVGTLMTTQPALFPAAAEDAVAEHADEGQSANTEPSLDIDQLKPMMVIDTLIKLLTTICAVVWIKTRRRATLEDFGVVPGQIAADLRLGVAAFLALAAPVYLIQLVMTQLTPSRHPLTTALLENPDAVMLALTILAAVVTAPLVEEFAFRLLFQGWMEAVVSRYRHILARPPVDYEAPTPTDDEPALPAERFREGSPVAKAELVDPEIASNPYAPPRLEVDENAASAAHAEENEAGLQRIAWGPIAISAICFALMHVAHGPDIIALTVLALGLGYLYQRTHRILPCVIVHLCLNATSVLLLWLSRGQ